MKSEYFAPVTEEITLVTTSVMDWGSPQGGLDDMDVNDIFIEIF